MSRRFVTLRYRIAARLESLAARIEPDYVPLTPEQTNRPLCHARLPRNRADPCHKLPV